MQKKTYVLDLFSLLQNFKLKRSQEDDDFRIVKGFIIAFTVSMILWGIIFSLGVVVF